MNIVTNLDAISMHVMSNDSGKVTLVLDSVSDVRRMTPAQARELASTLLEHANTIDKPQQVQSVLQMMG